MSKQILIEGSVSFAWVNERFGDVFPDHFYLDPERRMEITCLVEEKIQKYFGEINIHFTESNLVQYEDWDPAEQFYVGGFQPNLILGVAAGGVFNFQEDKDSDIELSPLKSAWGSGELGKLNILGSDIVNQLCQQMEELKKVHPDKKIIAPFFWDASGRATIHGVITTAQKLVGQDIFISFFEEPEKVHDLLAWIADSYIQLIKKFSEYGDVEPNSLHIGECSACMVSPDQFREFIVPHTQTIVDAIGTGRLHSCGNVDHLLEPFSELRNITCVNTGSNTSIARSREIFGSSMRLETTPIIEDLVNCTAEEIAGWTERNIEENQDGEMMIVYHLDKGIPDANILAMHQVVERHNRALLSG